MSLKDVLAGFEGKELELNDKALSIRYDKLTKNWQLVTIAYNLDSKTFKVEEIINFENDRMLCVERYKILAVDLNIV